MTQSVDTVENEKRRHPSPLNSSETRLRRLERILVQQTAKNVNQSAVGVGMEYMDRLMQQGDEIGAPWEARDRSWVQSTRTTPMHPQQTMVVA